MRIVEPARPRFVEAYDEDDYFRATPKAQQSTQQKIQELFKDSVGDMSLVSTRRLNAVSQRNSKLLQQLTGQSLTLQRSTTRLLSDARSSVTGGALDLDLSTKEVVELLVALDSYRKVNPIESDNDDQTSATGNEARSFFKNASPHITARQTSQSARLFAEKAKNARKFRCRKREEEPGTRGSLHTVSSVPMHGHNESTGNIMKSRAKLAAVFQLVRSSADIPLLKRPQLVSRMSSFMASESGQASRLRSYTSLRQSESSIPGNMPTEFQVNPAVMSQLRTVTTAPPDATSFLRSQSFTKQKPIAEEQDERPKTSPCLGTVKSMFKQGSTEPAPFSGAFGSLRRRAKLISSIGAKASEMNPAGFIEDVAAAEVAAYRTAVDRCEHWMRLQVRMPTDPAWEHALRHSVLELHYRRPYFNPPVPPYEPKLISKPPRSRPEKPDWDINDSIFRPRKVESDARDYCDTPLVFARQIDVDWMRVTTKERFRRFVAKADESVRESRSDLDKVFKALQAMMLKYAQVLRSVFVYYCSLGTQTSDSAFGMSTNDFRMFLADCNIADPASEHCHVEHCDTIFVSTNFEEDKKSFESTVNSDVQLMRFEFMEALVRLAHAKYVQAGVTGSIVDGFEMLMERNVLPLAPPYALHDVSQYRRERLYNRDVDMVLREHEELLKALYNLYKIKTNTPSKHLALDRWLALLSSNNLLGNAVGVSVREAKLLFSWSLMLVVDEIQRRQRSITLTFIDFLEAFSRFADLVSPPPIEELPEILMNQLFVAPDNILKVMETHPYYTYYRGISTDRASAGRRASASLMPDSDRRPLAPKIAAIMDFLVPTLFDVWQVDSYDRLLSRIKNATKRMLLGR